MSAKNFNTLKNRSAFPLSRAGLSNELANEKSFPQAPEIEEAVLGAILLERNALMGVAEMIKTDFFYVEANQLIFEAILAIFERGESIDLLTVCNELRKNSLLEKTGGIQYVSHLTTRINSAVHLDAHCRILNELAIRRQVIRTSDGLVKDAYEGSEDVFELLDKAQQSLFDISEQNTARNYAPIKTILQETFAELEQKRHQKDGLTGIPTGFIDLDRLTSGWQKSDLVILAARPGMGKCLGKGTKVLMFDGSLRKVEDIRTGDLLMGADSTPRKVLSTAFGIEQMYWIRQNKAIDYRVNESHILSLKRSRNEGKHQKGDILTISVKDFLQKSEKFRSNYKGYKVAVEFAEKALPIDAYFLGLWLGDGNISSVNITNQDKEIIEYLEKYALLLGLQVTVSKQVQKTPKYAITKGQRGKQFFFSLQNELRKLFLLNNKHIPEVFLINSKQNRLELLAGLIDSDGHYEAVSNSYEISQKNEELARQIKFLADSLGFRTSIRKKKASISSINYTSEVFRVRIFGNIDQIPVKVTRKKAKAWKSKVDWQVTGLKIEKDSIDHYYGFELDGDGLFLLEDMSVTHNTSFILSVLRNAAVDHRKPVVLFSLEMSAVQLANRLISAEAELESHKLKTGKLADYEWEQIVHKMTELNESPIFIDDTPALSVMELRAKARRLKAQNDIQLIIIDYLQLMQGDAKSGNREQEIAHISRSLKQIAKELNVPVIALSQLSRAVETRGGDKRPMLSDLRESGSIEQDADMVIFLYRPEYYQITEDAEGNSVAGMAEVIIAKHRNGALDSVWLKFVGKYTKFENSESSSFASFGDEGFEQQPNMVILKSRMNDNSPPPDFGNEPPF